MNANLRMNYISLWISIFFTFPLGITYFLLGKSMGLLAKAGYALAVTGFIILVVYNIVDIIRKVSLKNK